MKSATKTLALALLMLTLSACGSSTNVVGSWKKPDATARQFSSVFVSALTTNIPAKSAIENGLQQALAPRLKVYKSVDVFPPNFESTNMGSQSALLDKIKSTTADAIMTVALVDKDREERYVRGTPYNPGLRYGYYGRYSLYWGAMAPMYYTPGYYVTDKIYYLETNLFDAKTEELIWSAQSATYNPGSLDSFLKGYVKSVQKQMVADGLLARQ